MLFLCRFDSRLPSPCLGSGLRSGHRHDELAAPAQDTDIKRSFTRSFALFSSGSRLRPTQIVEPSASCASHQYGVVTLTHHIFLRQTLDSGSPRRICPACGGQRCVRPCSSAPLDHHPICQSALVPVPVPSKSLECRLVLFWQPRLTTQSTLTARSTLPMLKGDSHATVALGLRVRLGL